MCNDIWKINWYNISSEIPYNIIRGFVKRCCVMDWGENMAKECCGKCKYHVKGEVPGDGDWICNNGEAEEYGTETPYSHCCDEYEEK